MNKPELISFSDFLMLAPFFDQRQFFAPEIEHLKNGIDSLMQSGLINKEPNPLIEYHGKVAVLKIDGPMRPGKDWYFSVGYGDIQDAIVELIDADIETVIQYLNTPGGTVKQAFETEEMFYELAKEKRLISAIDMATSAGALMTFPAHERYLLSKTSQTGSIGVVAEHYDARKYYEDWGIKVTSVAKGDYKDAGTDTRAYDAKAKEVFEESVSKLHSIFVTAAVNGLGKTFEEIDAQQSRIYIGQDGINAGFAQGFSTLNQLIEKYNQEQQFFSTPGRPAFSNIHTEETIMDIKELEAKHPDVYQAVFALGKTEGEKASNETATKEGKAAGILEERARIMAIEALSMPADFTEKAKTDGLTPEQAAMAYLKLDAENRKKIAANIEGSLENSVATDAPDMPSDPDPKEKKAVTGKSSEEEMKAEFESNEDLQKEFGGDFECYSAFLRAEARGQARILNKGGK